MGFVLPVGQPCLLHLVGKSAYVVENLVDETGIEPATFPVKPGRSPLAKSSGMCKTTLVDETGIEPATSSLRTMRSPS